MFILCIVGFFIYYLVKNARQVRSYGRLIQIKIVFLTFVPSTMLIIKIVEYLLIFVLCDYGVICNISFILCISGLKNR